MAGFQGNYIGSPGSVGGTGSSVQSITSSDSSLTVTGTTSPNIVINLANSNAWTAAQSITISDGGTTTAPTCITFGHETSGTSGVGFGSSISFVAETTTTSAQSQSLISSVWLVATHASRSSQIQFQTVSNAGALSTGLTVGSGISGATAGLIIGGFNATIGGIWGSGVAPSSTNYGLIIDPASNTQLNGATNVYLKIASVSVMQINSTGIISYRNISTAGLGVPSIYGSANITAQSSNATICTYTNAATDGDFEVSAAMNVTAATGISTSLSVTYTDVNNAAQTLILPVQLAGGTGGTYLASGLVIATGDYSTPVQHIRVKASTVITVKTAAGTFTGVTYSASGKIKQTNSGNT